MKWPGYSAEMEPSHMDFEIHVLFSLTTDDVIHVPIHTVKFSHLTWILNLMIFINLSNIWMILSIMTPLAIDRPISRSGDKENLHESLISIYRENTLDIISCAR